MTPEEWRKVKEVLQTALELAPQGRETFLDKECAGQISVRREVESLLRSDEQDRAFLEEPAGIDAAELVTDASAWVGRRLGPYELLEKIGEGGMGDVYRAVRADGMYDKQVAIKLIHSGLSTDFFLSRFKNERQILAALEHPNIARLLDGGVAGNRMPYVVLEFVAGVPIDEYCARHDLSITDRLKLFRTVCSAVQYAHRNLVVHRDLKPGNILVTEDGTPKLLDFGIAKILNPQQEQTGVDRTLTVMRIMTPDFASPEQVRGDPITTSSDVYSLGVILYVLLTGRRPYHVSSIAPHEILKAICDMDPEKPSTAVSRPEKPEKAIKSDSAAGVRAGTEPKAKREKLTRELAGDLDNIVLKALRKEPERRYTTVEQFSEDVRRHLENLPVIARKDTPGYRASKFVLRHKVGVAAAAIFSVLLSGALGFALREARIARANELRAERRFNDVRALANSLMFEVHDSIRELPGATDARKLIIQRAQEYLDSLAQESKSDPALLRELAAAYGRLADVQGNVRDANVGNTAKALENYGRAAQLREAVVSLEPGNRDARRELAESYSALAVPLENAGNRGSANEAEEKAVKILEPLIATNPSDLKAQTGLAYVYMNMGVSAGNNLIRGTECYEKALSIYERLAKAEPRNRTYQVQLSFAHKHIGAVLGVQKQFQRALDHYGAALVIDEAQLALDPGNARSRYNITFTYSDTGWILAEQGDFDGALNQYRKALEIRAALASADPQDTRSRGGLSNTYNNIAEILRKKGEHEKALESYKKALAIREILSQKDPMSEFHRFALADTQAGIGNLYAEMAFGGRAKPEDQLAFCRQSETFLQKALPVFVQRQAKGKLDPSDLYSPLTDGQKNLDACSQVIARLNGPDGSQP